MVNKTGIKLINISMSFDDFSLMPYDVMNNLSREYAESKKRAENEVVPLLKCFFDNIECAKIALKTFDRRELPRLLSESLDAFAPLMDEMVEAVSTMFSFAPLKSEIKSEFCTSFFGCIGKVESVICSATLLLPFAKPRYVSPICKLITDAELKSIAILEQLSKKSISIHRYF